MNTFVCVIVLAIFLAKILAVPIETLVTESTAAASEVERVQDDPELTAGLFEGDMNVTMSRNGIIDSAKRWPNATVYFKMDFMFDINHTLHIVKALQVIESKTCIRFRHANDNTTAFIYFINLPMGCGSEIGHQGRIQFILLRADPIEIGCFRFGSIIHEILHSLGLFHQQSDSVRDDFVKIVTENIIEGAEQNFVKYDNKTVTNFGLPYDYDSVLHYSAYAFSKNGKETIVPLKATNVKIGLRHHLSDIDAKKLNLMYNC